MMIYTATTKQDCIYLMAKDPVCVMNVNEETAVSVQLKVDSFTSVALIV